MRSHFRSILTALTLVAQICMSGAVQADVLCVGRDGHVAIESPTARAACERHNRLSVVPPPPVAGFDQVGNHLGDCVDVPIAGSGEAVASAAVKCTTPEASRAILTSFSAFLLPPTDFRPVPSGEVDSPPCHFTLTELRTVVLVV